MIAMIGTTAPYWQNQVDGLYFGSYPDKKYTIKALPAIFDSGWTTVSMPKTQLDFIKTVILKDVTYTTSGGWIKFSCAQFRSKMPSLFFRFGGYWIEVRSEDYANEYPLGSDTCTLFIDEQEDFWVLGMTAMRGYYIVHDYTTDKLGLIPQKDGQKSTIVYDPATSSAETPLEDPAKEDLPWWAWLLIGLAVVIVAVVVVVVTQEECEDGEENCEDGTSSTSNNSGKVKYTNDVWETMKELRPKSSSTQIRRAIKCMANDFCEDIPSVQSLLAQIDPDYPDWVAELIQTTLVALI